ncbi:methyl-accepting chemotaxis protein [Castellaniella hirudinis]|uniref:methyl-accepting chemotaxis protein n=1 Tax=Castellaniella hirudinis TaxID=1144617 RepID=UPI0039C32DEE
MRKNLPVTQNNYLYPAHQTLISITDLKGRITYCNKDFIDVSGYTEAELIGQPHNILRHPDMPEEAFRDFWASIQSGKLWSALIKNRRKNGDSYWVRANATPMRNGDQVVGYLSVRTLPSPREIEKAEALYAQLRAEEQQGRLKHVFKGGIPRRAGFLGRLNRVLRPGRGARAAYWLALAVAAPVLAVAAGSPVWGVALAAALAGLAAWMGIRANLISPQDRAALVAKRLAGGDLADFVDIENIQATRQILLPVSQLALATRTVMVDVRHDLQGLGEKAGEIAARSNGLEERTQVQATSLVQTASAMEEISGTVEQTSQTTTQGVQTVREASQAVAHSQAIVQDVAGLMQEIAQSSSDIGEFIQVIEGVAFQTNILALNASVEAARAGEHGRGFAVVASEVRALSQRTTTAAKEIKALIDESEARVKQGNTRVQAAKAQMEDVVRMVDQVKLMLEEINLASSEQASGVQEVNQALHRLDEITQQNAEMVAGLALLCDDMNLATQKAQNNIRVFRLSSQDVTHAEADAVGLRKSWKARQALPSDAPPRLPA